VCLLPQNWVILHQARSIPQTAFLGIMFFLPISAMPPPELVTKYCKGVTLQDIWPTTIVVYHSTVCDSGA
jgi:hypothetical protein